MLDVKYNFLVRSSENIKIQINTTELNSNYVTSTPVYTIKANEDFLLPYVVPFVGIDGYKERLRLIISADNDTIEELNKKRWIGGKFINKTIEIETNRNNYLIFIETNKPIYKPGDLIKLRAFSIHMKNLRRNPESYDLKQWSIRKEGKKFMKKEFNDTFDYKFNWIIIENARKQRVAQWNDVDMEKSMNLTYQLIKDAAIGKWKIRCKFGDMEEEYEFEVKKFVLPRFVVNIKEPKQILFSDKYVKFSICATYSTGKTMNALIEGKFCYTTWKNNNCRYFKESISIGEKCKNIKISNVKLGIYDKDFSYYSSKSLINVTVTELGTTSTVFKSISSIGLSDKAFKIEMKSRSYYKPGLPYFGKFELIKINGEPQSYSNVTVSINDWGSNYAFRQNYTSNEDGIIDFIIPYIPNNVYASIRVESVDKKEDKMYAPDSYQRVSPWISTENKHLQISPISEDDIECGKKFEQKLKILTNVKKSKIYVNIFGRGQIQKSFTFDDDSSDKCEPRDDYIGHYTCVDNNKIECLKGWSGGNCREPVCEDECISGICISPNKCECKQGWGGKDCSICIKRKGCVNGDCFYGGDCRCRNGWKGYNCNITGPIKVDYKTTKAPMINKTEIKPLPKYQNQTIYERNIMIPLSSDIGPDIHILVYMITNKKEVVADSLEIKNCKQNVANQNEESFKFIDGNKVRPGSNITLEIKTGTKEKSCAIRIIDVAIEQYGKSSSVTLDELLKRLNDLNHRIANLKYSNLYRPLCIDTKNRFKRSIAGFYGDYYDSRAAFAKTGIRAITDLKLVHALCRPYVAYLPMAAERQYDTVSVQRKNIKLTAQKDNLQNEVKKVKEKIRSYFPESWLFNYYKKMKENEINLKVPDSITTWKTYGYCFTEDGLRIFDEKKLKVLLPFYVDVYVPYSIKLGEELNLPVKIFNYMDDCFEIQADLKVDSREIKITGASSFTMCTCKDDIKTMSFKLEPKVIGEKINVTVFAESRYSDYCSGVKGKKSKMSGKMIEMRDAVRRSFIVEAPGVPEETTSTEFLCANKKNENQMKLKSYHEIPKEAVNGSLRSYLKLVGNVFGSALDDVGRLTSLPTGCGEQNMAKAAPAVYVYGFLSSVGGKQNKELVDRVLGYIKTGVANQDKFQHPEGSYSAFGPKDKSTKGSTWLTAFVLRVFWSASQYTKNIIDDKKLMKSAKFLINQQDTKTGCFKEEGRLLSSVLAGGSGSSRSSNTDVGLLSSYVMIALGLVGSNTATNLPLGLSCIRNDLEKNGATAATTGSNYNYRLVLATYAFVINDPKSKYTKELLKKVEAASTKEGRYRFWRASNEKKKYSWFSSADIETTGYAYMALSLAGETSIDLLDVINWLVSEQSSLGGYYSTQDTSIAMETLSIFAKSAGVSKTEGFRYEVNLQSDSKIGISTVSGNVSRETQLVLEQKALGSDNFTFVSMSMMGEGCASVQLASLYTVMRNSSSSIKTFRVDAEQVECSRDGTKVRVQVCSGYLRLDKSSGPGGMVLVTVGLPSGWLVAEKDRQELLEQVDKIPQLEKLEFPVVGQTQRVNLYYNGFSYQDAEQKTNRCIKLSLERSPAQVENLKPANVRIADYYRPELFSETSYTLTCRPPSPPRPDPSPTCPKCSSTFNDLVNTVCDTQFAIIVPNKNNPYNITFYQPYSDSYYQYNIEFYNPLKCKCYSDWFNNKNQSQSSMLVATPNYFSIIEQRLLLDESSTVFGLEEIINQLYSVDVVKQCGDRRSVSYLKKLLVKLRGSDFVESINEKEKKLMKCARYVSDSTIYVHFNNSRELYCNETESGGSTNFSAITVTIRSIDKDGMKVIGEDEKKERVVLKFENQSCYSLLRLVVGKEYRILLDVEAANQNGELIKLNENCIVLEQQLFITSKTRFYCKNNKS